MNDPWRYTRERIELLERELHHARRIIACWQLAFLAVFILLLLK